MTETKMKTAGGNFPSNTQKSSVSTFGIDNHDGILDLTELLNNGYEIETSVHDEHNIEPFVFWVDGVVLSIVSVFGVIGTLMAIVVLIKPRIRGNSRDLFSKFLTALAVYDSFFLCLALLMFGVPSLSTWYGQNIVVHIIPFCNGLVAVARTGSVYVTISITVERYFAIVHPLKDFMAIKKVLLPFTITFSIVFNVIKFFEMESYKFIDGSIAVRKTNLGKNHIYVTYYAFWSKIIFMEAVPYFVIFILNAIIVLKIYDSIRFRKRFQRESTNKRDSISLKIPLVKCDTRKQSTPMLRKKELGDFECQQNIHFLSTSNLDDNDDGVNTVKISKQVMLQEASVEEKQTKTGSDTSIRNMIETKEKHDSLVQDGMEMEILGTIESQPKDMVVTCSSHCDSAPKINLQIAISDENYSSNDHFNSVLSSASPLSKKNSLQGQNIMVSSAQQTITNSNCNSRINNVRQSTVSTSPMPTAEALRSKSKREQEISLAVTLVLIAVVFICCQFVKLIADAYEVIYCERPSATDDSLLINDIDSFTDRYNRTEKSGIHMFNTSLQAIDNGINDSADTQIHPDSLYSGNQSSMMYNFFEDEIPRPQSEECLTNNFIEWAISISNLLTVVNSAANFLIYMLRGKKFRDIFLQTYFSSCIKNRQENSYRMNDSMAPGQTNLLGTKSFTGARYTAMGQTYNTTMSRIESEFAGEQTEVNGS